MPEPLRMSSLLGRPRTVLLVLIVISVLVGHRALFVRQDNSPETFFSADPLAKEQYRELVRAFGGDEVLIVELRGARLDRPSDLQNLAVLSRGLRRLPGVRTTASLADLHALDDDSSFDAEALAPLRAEAEALPLYHSLGLYRPEVPALGILCTLIMTNSDERARFMAGLRTLLGDTRFGAYRPLVAGLTPANAAIDRETRRTATVFLPLTALFTAFLGLVLFRSARGVLCMLLPVGGSVAVGAGLLELLGEPINLVTGVMPPLILAIGFAAAVHVVSRYARLRADGQVPDQAVRATIDEKLGPTAFALGTTAIGFGSLVLSDLHPVRILGLVSAASLVMALPLVTLGTPALLLLLKPTLHAPEHRHAWLLIVARAALRRRLWVFIGTLLVFLPLGLGIGQLRTSIDGVSLLSDDVPEKQDFMALEREGLGLNAIDLWVRGAVPDHRALLEQARRLVRLARRLEQDPLITGSMGVHDLLELFQRRSTGRSGLPDSLAALDLMDPEPRQEFEQKLRFFWNPQKGLKLTLMARTVEQASLDRLRALIEQEARVQFPDRDVLPGGHFMMLIGTPSALIDTMRNSLLSSVGIIAFIFILAFRRLRLVLPAMIVNLLPVAGILGLMGWMGLSVDVATVMTASVAFGLAVDDTFHYMHHLRRSGSLLKAASVAGQGIMATTLMTAGGFAVLGLSGFNPVVRFGLLTAVAMLMALSLDALLLPALVGCQGDLDPECTRLGSLDNVLNE